MGIKKMLIGVLIVLAGLFLLSASTVLAQGEPCTADFNCDQNVDATDVDTFLSQFGRNPFNDPCPDCYDSSCPCGTCIICEGTLSPLGRWCDQGDGTVKDMTTGLVWLKRADWGGLAPWEDCINHNDAHTRAAQLWDGSPWEGDAGLSDGSGDGDWRLPTKEEFYHIQLQVPEAVSSNNMQLFTGVQASYYWSSTTDPHTPSFAWEKPLFDPSLFVTGPKSDNAYVWPVRAGYPSIITTTTTTIGPLCDEVTDCGEGYCCGYASGQELGSGGPLYCTSKINEAICFFCNSASDCAYSIDNPCCCNECADLGLGFPASICWHPTPCGIGCGGTCLP